LERLHLPHAYNIPVEFLDEYVAQLGYELYPKNTGAKAVKVLPLLERSQTLADNATASKSYALEEKALLFQVILLVASHVHMLSRGRVLSGAVISNFERGTSFR
jgi:hypothetical protein